MRQSTTSSGGQAQKLTHEIDNFTPAQGGIDLKVLGAMSFFDGRLGFQNQRDSWTSPGHLEVGPAVGASDDATAA